ncbi:MAG: metallophosphatase [Candidatus Latescibacteria bacterium]|nr:metallophosphatase [Candidatus Latescibacterota bacterium]MBT5831854.1 metallophosphatase [Candidatus Latescibacterota bacterium]
MGRTIFIGDVHGCAEEFRHMLDKLKFERSNDLVFLTGDAFTKGPDALGVWKIIREIDAKMVMGNHDVALLERLRVRLNGKEKKLKKEHKRILDDVMPVVDDLVAWIEGLPLYIETQDFLLVHAGINPEKELGGTSQDEFVTIRTWPPKKGVEGDRWHDAYQPIRPLVIFGHDAPNGLVIKKQKKVPYLVGLDSGCVYGNALSAYILEERLIVQVASLQPKQFAN